MNPQFLPTLGHIKIVWTRDTHGPFEPTPFEWYFRMGKNGPVILRPGHCARPPVLGLFGIWK